MPDGVWAGDVKKICIIGLDGLSPELLFGTFWDELPSFRALAKEGGATRLESCIPPITVPAWLVMMTGRDPGELGIYGFHDRVIGIGRYDAHRIPSSADVSLPLLWELLGEHTSAILGVPPTYPPRPMPTRGTLVTDCLTPNDAQVFTSPPSLSQELVLRFGPFIADVENFRDQEEDVVVHSLMHMTEQRFAMAEYLWRRDDPDFLMMVDMGIDRVQHRCWGKTAVRAYYRFVDTKLSAFRRCLDDDTILLVVSDHGAQALRGTFALNQWLCDHGYLCLKQAAAGPTRFDAALVDWSRTRAWGQGGYVGRVYLNLEGREACGIVSRNEGAALLSEIAQGLAREPIPMRCLKPAQLYRCVNGPAPDLFLYCDELGHRVLGGFGQTLENDHANHAAWGVLLCNRPLTRTDVSLYDVAPTILSQFGVTVPTELRGTPFLTEI